MVFYTFMSLTLPAMPFSVPIPAHGLTCISLQMLLQRKITQNSRRWLSAYYMSETMLNASHVSSHFTLKTTWEICMTIIIPFKYTEKLNLTRLSDFFKVTWLWITLIWLQSLLALPYVPKPSVSPAYTCFHSYYIPPWLLLDCSILWYLTESSQRKGIVFPQFMPSPHPSNMPGKCWWFNKCSLRLKLKTMHYTYGLKDGEKLQGKSSN